MKKRIIIIALIAALILSSCSSTANNFREDEKIMTGIETWEIELLCKAYKTNSEQKRVRSGELHDYQKELLSLLRNVCVYLEEKYPDYRTTVTNIEPEALMRSYSTFYFTVDGFDGTFTALADDDENNLTDNFYTELIKPKYDSAIKEMLEKECIAVVSVETVFTASLGKEYNADITDEKLFKCANEIPRTTTIFIKSSNPDADIKKAEEIIAKEYNIHGYYFINCSNLFIEGLSSDEYSVIVQNQSNEVLSTSFNVGNN